MYGACLRRYVVTTDKDGRVRVSLLPTDPLKVRAAAARGCVAGGRKALQASQASARAELPGVHRKALGLWHVCTERH